MSAFSTASMRRELEIRRYPLLVYVLVLPISLILQSWLPRVTGRFSFYDLPLLVTIYFSLSRRSPIHGTLLGALLGIFEDGLTHQAIGIHGIANTVAGYLGASVGSRIDVDNNFIRLPLNFLLSLGAGTLYILIMRMLLGLNLDWNWLDVTLHAVGNAVLGLVFFPLLDRTRSLD